MAEFMTLTECANELGYADTSTLRRAVKNNQLNATLAGKTYIVKRKDFEAFKAGLTARQGMDKRGWQKRGQKKTDT